MKLSIGSLVLCYLLSPTPNQEQPETIKIVGEVLEFQERTALYDNVENTQIAYAKKVDDLIVRGINRKGMYQINVNACKKLEKLGKNDEIPDLVTPDKIKVEVTEDLNLVEDKKLSKEDSKNLKAILDREKSKKEAMKIEEETEKGILDLILE